MRFARSSGVLLHPTSLPGPHGSGDLGDDAYRFVDWLVSAGQQLWQILPLGEIGTGNSPYMSSSAFAGNLLMVNLAELGKRGWLDDEDLAEDPTEDLADLSGDAHRIDFASAIPFRMERLARAAVRFGQLAGPAELEDFAGFCQRHAAWLDDYALYMTLSAKTGTGDWSTWDPDVRNRVGATLSMVADEHAQDIVFWKFGQWCFARQWAALKAYANDRGVLIIGDAPIFVSYSSADVWARPELFELDELGHMINVAGVPPDLFTTDGQRWGNPLYRWSVHASDGYEWWVERIRRTFDLVDIVRIDHFRGFAAHWAIPASEPTAVRGVWQPGPGRGLFDAIHAALGPLPIIAEDLGVITPDVVELRKAFNLPGMSILQFAFGNDASNTYLPHHHEHDTVVYTGTHDNDTSVGWWASLSDDVRGHVRDYLATDGSDIHWDFVRAACASVADTSIYPLQDVLGLGAAHRMNFPGQSTGHWGWRFTWEQVLPRQTDLLKQLCSLYNRLGASSTL